MKASAVYSLLRRYRHAVLVLLLGLVLTGVFFTVVRDHAQGSWETWGGLAGGSLITALLVAYLISMNHAGKIEGLVARLTKSNEDLEREITERRGAEERLWESEERHRTLVDLSSITISVVQDGKYVYVNSAGAKLFGAATREQLVGRRVVDFVHPNYRAQILERLRQMEEQGQLVDPLEVKCLRLDGQIIEVETMAALILYQGKPAVQGVLRDVTERKRAEEENRRLALAMANASDGITITDMDRRIIFANRATEKLCGYAPGEMLGMRGLEAYPESLRETTAREIFERTMDEGSWTGDVPLLSTTGEELHIRISTALIKDDEGHALGMVGISTDITERKRAEGENRRLALALANASDGVIIADMNRRISFANRAAEKMRGYAPGEMLGIRVLDTYPELLRETTAREIFERTRDEGSWSGEVPLLFKTGEELQVRMSTALIKDAEGHALGMVGIATDITERKRAEEENRRLALALANASDGVIITDMNRRISFANRAAEKMRGYAPGEMLGMKVIDTYPESSRETTAREIFERTRDEGSWTGEVPLLNKAGEELHVRMSTALIKDDEGHAQGMVAIATDVTERRQLEDQLVQARKMEAIGRLAGGVAHDFNNLLTAIIGYSHVGQTLQTGDDLSHASFREIQKAVERASELTQKLLAFSRHQVAEAKVVSLRDLIFDMDRMLRRLIDADIELVTLPAPDPGMVRIDPGQMEQVLTNLVVNARDSMPSGGKLVIETSNVTLDQQYARRHPGANAGDYIVVAVTDTGIGMTEEVKAHIFEPFFTTKGVGEGTGLGLSTCYGIVSKSGGHITVESGPGKGATFMVYLPRVDGVPSQPPMRDKPDEVPLGTETVFLVEDEPIVRSMVSQVLRERGYTVLESTNGVEALRVAEERAGEAFHLLLTDVVMPLMGGRDLAERLRTQHPETRVLFTSGYTDEAVTHPDPGTGTDFIQKPFTPTALALKVREVLDR